MRDTVTRERRDESGFGLLELSLGASVLLIGSMAMLTSLLTSVTVGNDARLRSLARDESFTVIEALSAKCATGFTTAVTEYSGRSAPCNSIDGGKTSTIVTTIALDETALNPPMDLNGDGDVLDKTLTPSNLAVLHVTAKASWKRGKKSETYAAVLSRRDLATGADKVQTPTPATPPSGTGTGTGTTTPPPPTPQIALKSCKVSDTQLQADMTLLENLNVAGMTINSSVTAYVKEIKMNGKIVFTTKNNLPPCGQMIVTSPYKLATGTEKIDYITFAGSPSGGKVSVKDSHFSIVFHTESGDRVLAVQ